MIVIEFVEACDITKNLTIVSSKVEVSSPQKNLYLFNGNFSVNEKVKGPLALVLTPHRCDLALIHCEPYQEFRFTHVCDQLTMKGALWTPLVKSFHPKINCPILPGKYKFINGSMDYSMMNGFPLDGYVWYAYYRLYSLAVIPSKQVFCIKSKGSITVSKRRTPK